MRTAIKAILGGSLSAAVIGVASGQAALPASSPASAAAPMTAASRQLPARNPVFTASENAKEPGNQRPEERVIPQISIPLKSRNLTAPAAATASSAPSSGLPGGIDEGAARCLALSSTAAKAACENRRAASMPERTSR
jgi:hypothetical protein